MNEDSGTSSLEAYEVRIPMRSRAQAMDESLTLVSQGISSTIDCDETGNWGLIVSREDYDRSHGVLEIYRRENRRWPWRQPIRPAVYFDWGSLAWVGLVCLFALLQGPGVDLQEAGAMDGAAVAHGQWWRLFTAVFLHADFGHLASNAGFGLVLLGLAMGSFGTGNGLLAAYLAGVAGNLFAWILEPTHRSVGASGMVLGCLGLLAAQSISRDRNNPWAKKSTVAALGAVLMLMLLLGSNPGSDLMAHAGGFVAGAILGGALRWWPRLARSATANVIAGGVFAWLVILTWTLAIRHG